MWMVLSLANTKLVFKKCLEKLKKLIDTRQKSELFISSMTLQSLVEQTSLRLHRGCAAVKFKRALCALYKQVTGNCVKPARGVK